MSAPDLSETTVFEALLQFDERLAEDYYWSLVYLAWKTIDLRGLGTSGAQGWMSSAVTCIGKATKPSERQKGCGWDIRNTRDKGRL